LLTKHYSKKILNPEGILFRVLFSCYKYSILLGLSFATRLGGLNFYNKNPPTTIIPACLPARQVGNKYF
jgi:hypothetical protein